MNIRIMQRIFLAIAFVFLPAFAIAENTKLSINVAEAGTLSELLAEDAETVETLTVSGELNEADISTMRYLLKEKSLANIDLGKVLVEDKLVVFKEIDQLISIVLPENMDTVADGAFRYCGYLESLTLPKNLKVIGNWSFATCGWLGSLDLPKTLTHIGDYAFEQSVSLRSVVLPGSLGRIKSYAIFSRSGIQSVIFEEGIISTGRGIFEVCTEIESIVLPNSLKRIDDESFFLNLKLTTITIPENVDTIGYGAFFSNRQLLSIYSKSPVPPVLEGAFSWDSKENSVVYVPGGSLETYKSAEGWEEFDNIEEGIITGVEESEVSNKSTVFGGVGELTVLLDESARVEIYTLTGVRSFSGSLNDGEHNLPLRAGIYLVKIGNLTLST